MPLVILTRVDDSSTQTFSADAGGRLDEAAVIAFANGSEVRVSTIYDNGNANNLADAVQATLADMPPLDLATSPLRIEYKAATDLEATITDAITDAVIVTADETGVWHYVADVAAGAFVVQSALGFKERAILAADTPAADIAAVEANMRRAWGSADTGQRLAIDTAAVAVNLTATLSGGGVYNVEWGDGSASIGVTSGVAATHTYAAPFAGDVVIRYPAATPLTEIRSTAGAWSFDLSDLAASVTYLNLNNTSSVVTGDIGDNSTLIILNLGNTSSVVTGDIGDNSTLTYLHLGGTTSTITGGTPFNTSGSARYFDFSDITPGYSTATVDAIINSLGAETTWTNEKLIDLSGTHSPRSSASDAAVSTLNGLGVSVVTNEAVTSDQALTIDTAAVAVNLTATLSGGGTYDVNWGDGTISTGVTSGVAATHTYAAPYSGDVFVRYPTAKPLTNITSSAGAWVFDLADLAASVTTLNLASTSSTITGDIGDNSTLTYLNLFSTSSTITGDIGDNSKLTTMHLASTSSTITGSIGDNSTLTYLNLGSTSSAITGDIGDNSKLTYLSIYNTSSTITGGTPFNTSGSARLFDFSDITPGYSTATVDAIINSLAAETTWSSEKLIDLSGTHDPRSSASDAAVSTLNGLGVTVTTSP